MGLLEVVPVVSIKISDVGKCSKEKLLLAGNLIRRELWKRKEVES